MERLKVGIVGYGGFGQFLRRSWARLDSVEVVAVADESARVEAGDIRLHRDWRALVQDPGVDVVSIATPPASHAEIACAAMDAGKHVLVEKPIATTREDARRMVEAQSRGGVTATVDFMLRFNPIVELLHRWAREQPFGALRRVLVENYAQDETLPREHWFWEPEKSGGILVEHAVHFIDVVHGCTTPDPTQVTGFQVARDDGRVDRMGLTAVYPDGLVMTQYHAFSRPGFFESTSMRFVFDLAQVDVSGWIPLVARVAALVSETTSGDIERLPGIRVEQRVSADELADQSRPAGWGGSVANSRSTRILSGGVAYPVEHLIEATWELPDDKATVYADCLCALMSDLVSAIHDPGHCMRVTLEDGRKSLDVALRASATPA